jgi:hypothetical protein
LCALLPGRVGYTRWIRDVLVRETSTL